MIPLRLPALLFAIAVSSFAAPAPGTMSRLAYNNPDLLVDLGVGLWAWPLPMDYNRDGRMDLVVVCTDKPYNGTWFFENSGRLDPATRLPVFKPAVNIGKSMGSVGISYVTGKPIVTSTSSLKGDGILRYRGNIYPDFLNSQFQKPVRLQKVPERIHTEPGNIRQNQWQLVDFDGDGALDVSLGVDFWGDYGWDNAFDAQGNWIKGPLHGFVYILRNKGTTDKPDYAAPEKVMAGGKPVDPFGMPSHMWGDFRGTGKLDLICGEFRDSFTFYGNIGSRSAPQFAAGRQLTIAGTSKPLLMDLCMITPTAVDFNGDGHLDIVCGDEDGRVAFIENTGKVVDGMPQFLAPRYFRQMAQDVKFGALITPYAVDWDGDGDDDLICGNSAGHISFLENLGGKPARWAAPVLLSASGKLIREQAGPNGSIQGPAEAKWGYSILSVADWDGDGLPDIVTNGIWGRIVWYKNVGTRKSPKLAAAQPVLMEPGAKAQKPEWNWWTPQGRECVTQWRTTPQIVDWDKDGLLDLVMLDHEGYLAWWQRRRTADGQLALADPKRVFWGEGSSRFDSNGRPTEQGSGLLQLNVGTAGKSGRRTFCVVDWDRDGVQDFLVNSAPNVNFLRGKGKDSQGRYVFEDMGPVSEHVLAGHATKPTVTDFTGDGVPDLLIGAEDGYIYQLPNPSGR